VRSECRIIGCQTAWLTWRSGCQPAVLRLFARLAAWRPSQPSWLTSDSAFLAAN
jgi:hypothetical protein